MKYCVLYGLGPNLANQHRMPPMDWDVAVQMRNKLEEEGYFCEIVSPEYGTSTQNGER